MFRYTFFSRLVPFPQSTTTTREIFPCKIESITRTRIQPTRKRGRISSENITGHCHAQKQLWFVVINSSCRAFTKQQQQQTPFVVHFVMHSIKNRTKNLVDFSFFFPVYLWQQNTKRRPSQNSDKTIFWVSIIMLNQYLYRTGAAVLQEHVLLLTQKDGGGRLELCVVMIQRRERDGICCLLFHVRTGLRSQWMIFSRRRSRRHWISE